MGDREIIKTRNLKPITKCLRSGLKFPMQVKCGNSDLFCLHASFCTVYLVRRRTRAIAFKEPPWEKFLPLLRYHSR